MNTNNNLLSICCLGYNHAKFIVDNINAIWSSDYKDIEIIVVDDGSKDDSGKILKDLQAKSPFPMKVILQENTGNIGYNFNVALHKAHGEFISFISLDDILYPEKIKKCINMLIENKNLAFIASSKVSAIDSNGKSCDKVPPLKLDSLKNISIDDLLELEYREFGSFYIQGVFFRKKIIEAVSGFDEDIIGDDIILRTKVFKYIKEHPEYSFTILNEPTCRYRRHGDNISCNSKRQIQIVTEYLQRYWNDRKNPDILISWTLHTINNLTFKDCLNIFSMNARAASLLSDNKIQQSLIKKIKTENSVFRYLFLKEKHGQKRIIKIFNCIKITYIKKLH